MYKVISVTSNIETQHLIKSAVLSSSQYYQLYGQFSNSIDALEIATIQKPDLIFFSDQMSFIGTTQFIQSLTRKGIRALYVILENNNEIHHIDFAVNLIQARISEESLTHEKICELLQKIQADLSAKEHLSYYAQTTFQADYYSFPWLEENQVFAQLLNTPLDSMDLHTSAVACQQGYLLIGMPRSLPGEIFSFFYDLQKLNVFYQKARLLLEAYGKGNLFIIQENKLCIWIEPSSPVIMRESFFTELCSSVNAIFEYGDVSRLVFQRSDAKISLESLPQTYRAVDRLCSYRFFLDDQTILSSDWLSTNSVTISLEVIQDVLNDLEQSFESRNLTEYENCIRDLFLLAQNSMSFNTYAHIWNQLIFWYNQKVQQYKLPTEQYAPSFGQTSFSRLEDAREAILTLMTNLFSAIATIHLQSGSYYISHALSYLNAHITEEVTLSEVAKHIHITASYLSQLFQKELNKSFVEIRTELRIALAKDLLKKDYKIYEVALLSGFNNEKYFSQVFKKVTGITPRTFRITKGGTTYEED